MDEEKRYTKVLEIIKRRLIPDEIAKKDRGEVFTPLNLVREMLYGKKKSKTRCADIHSDAFYACIFGMDASGGYMDMADDERLGGIPLDVWRNPNSRWLDPANGIGNFPVVTFYMLDYQLGKHAAGLKGPGNRLKRHKHIIENMLFMMEIEKGNCNTTKKIFKLICPEAQPNICCTDALKITNEHMDRAFKGHEFDVVMGNPPFNAYQEAEEKRGGGDSLYPRFIKRGLEWTKADGYLVYVHPPTWRKPESERSKNRGFFKLMAHNNYIQYLEIHNAIDGNYVFNASTTYDFYTIQKRAAGNSETIINDELRNIAAVSLKKFDFLPNFNIKNVNKLLADTDDDRCAKDKCLLFERSLYGSDDRIEHTSDKESAEFKYPLIHSITKSGPRFMYSSDNTKGLFGVKKVIIGESSFNKTTGTIYDPILDLNGKYGMTQGAMAIAIDNKEEGEELVKFLKSTFFGNVLLACNWSYFRIDWRLFTYFKNNFWDVEYDANEPPIIIEDIRGPAKAAAKTRGAASKGGRRTRKLKRRN